MDGKRELILFYGAGAEKGYSMPIGLEYRENTILLPSEEGNTIKGSENSILEGRLNALKKFYAKYDHEANHTGSLKGWITKYERRKYNATFDVELLRAYSIYYSEQQRNQDDVIIAAIKIFRHSFSNDQKMMEILNDYFEKSDQFFVKEKNRYVVNEKKVDAIVHSAKSREVQLDKERFEFILGIFSGIDNGGKINYHSFKKALMRKSEDKKARLEEVANKINGFGDIEQYFHTFINPKKYGRNKYWMLVNFYWFCWFEMMDAMIKKQLDSGNPNDNAVNNNGLDKYVDRQNKRMNYGRVFDDIHSFRDFLKKVYSVHRQQFEKFRNDNFLFRTSHFRELNSMGYKVSIATTNYTPYTRWAVEASGSNIKEAIYLNGELDVFQNPNSLEVKKIQGHRFANDMIVPYLLAQTAIKPIIAQYQISEYCKLIARLNNDRSQKSVMVIVGYALNEDDNHINSMIRDFLMAGNKVIYARYVDEEKEVLNNQWDKKTMAQKLCGKLKIDSKYDLTVLDNIKGKEDLFDRIAQVLSN